MSSSSGTRGDRREQVAAIVNLDAGARVGDDTVRLGQTYALQLRNQSGPNFT